MKTNTIILLLIITGHLEWESIRRPGLYVGHPSSRLRNIYTQIYHFLLGQFFYSARYCLTSLREHLGRPKGEYWGIFCYFRSIIFNGIGIFIIILRRRMIPWYPRRSYLPLSGPGFGAYCYPSCTNCPWTAQITIWNGISPCRPNPSSFDWSPILLSLSSQWIILFSSPFCAFCLRQTQTFPSGGGVSRIHG